MNTLLISLKLQLCGCVHGNTDYGIRLQISHIMMDNALFSDIFRRNVIAAVIVKKQTKEFVYSKYINLCPTLNYII